VYPLYMPAQLRLAALARDAGDLDEAATILRAATDRARSGAAAGVAGSIPGIRRGAPLAEDARDALVMLAALEA